MGIENVRGLDIENVRLVEPFYPRYFVSKAFLIILGKQQSHD